MTTGILLRNGTERGESERKKGKRERNEKFDETCSKLFQLTDAQLYDVFISANLVACCIITNFFQAFNNHQ